MPGAERHIKVFTYLACVDTMTVIYTKMLTDKQRK